MAGAVKNQASDGENESGGGCYPCHPCKFLPVVENCFPATWTKIQDWIHMMLVAGLFGCILLIGQSCISLFNSSTIFTPGLAEARAVLVVVFAFPLSIYCSKTINQYDEKLQDKQGKVKKEKAKLLGCYKDLLSDMDGLLSKSTESASGLAERSFESKRRDFQRFLDRAKARFDAGGIETEEMLTQFRRFCVNWLNVFKECSIDPVDSPKLVITEEELVSYVSISEIATVVSDRLQTTEVRFITEQRKNDTNNLNERRHDFQKMAHSGVGKKVPLAITNDGNAEGSFHTQRSGSFMQSPSGRNLELTKPRQMTWLTCGKVGCTCEPNATNEEGCPRTFNCMFVQLIMLSRQHASLVGSFFLGSCAIGIALYLYFTVGDNAAQGEESFVIIFMAISLACLVVVLFKFEQIDVVQQLQREVEELMEQNKQVTEQQKTMRDFWNKAQQLTELWLYRTVPRLDLCKELHSQLEDTTDDDEMLKHMEGANDGLEQIESRLGSLENWRGDGLLKIDDKKNFGKVINELCQEQDPETVLEKIQEVVNSKEMKAIGYSA